MKRFSMIVKSVVTILAVVPFTLIGVLVVATFSKPELKDPAPGRKPHHEVIHAAPLPNISTEGPPVVIERPDSKISRLLQPGCVDVGKPCETPTDKTVGVWGETVLKKKPS